MAPRSHPEQKVSLATRLVRFASACLSCLGLWPRSASHSETYSPPLRKTGKAAGHDYARYASHSRTTATKTPPAKLRRSRTLAATPSPPRLQDMAYVQISPIQHHGRDQNRSLRRKLPVSDLQGRSRTMESRRAQHYEEKYRPCRPGPPSPTSRLKSGPETPAYPNTGTKSTGSSGSRGGAAAADREAERLLTAFSTELLTPDVLAETLHRFDRAMRHVAYAVVGVAAMAAWGCTDKVPYHVAVLVPCYAKDAVRSWAKVAGFELFRTRADLIGVHTSDGQLRKVRVKFCPGEDWPRVRPVRVPMFLACGGDGTEAAAPESDGNARPAVMPLPGLLNLAAEEFASARCAADSHARASVGRDVVWMLRRIAAREAHSPGAEPLHPTAIPAIYRPGFWADFVAAHPDAPALFVDAGLRPELLPRIDGRCVPRFDQEFGRGDCYDDEILGVYGGRGTISGRPAGSGSSSTVATAATDTDHTTTSPRETWDSFHWSDTGQKSTPLSRSSGEYIFGSSPRIWLPENPR